MSKATTKMLVPKLRFPEFRDAGEWEVKRLKDFESLNHGDGDWILSKDISKNGEYEIIQLGNIGLGEFIEKPMKTISEDKFKELGGTRINEGDLLINRMVDSNLYCCIFKKNGDYITSVDVCWIRNNHYFNNYFLMNLFLHSPNQHKLLNLSSGSGRVRISKKNLFEKFNFLIPEQPEQQKIADCLSSLDALITAHSQKHQALKAHKKGLMQQLFPAEGKTVPKLRFPEFDGEEEWVEDKFGDITNFASGGTPSKDKAEYWNGNVPWISAASMHDICIENSDRNITNLAIKDGAQIASKGTLLLLVRGSMLHKRIPIGIAKRDVAFNQDVKALNLKKNILEMFLLYLLIANEMRLLGTVTKTGIGAGKLDTNDLKDFLVCVPKSSAEQQKIADCLSSIDALITAQAQKIESLKAHKKGLMQQLFPVDEVSV